MNNDDILEKAQEAIRLGERTRILFEIIMSELGMNYENTQKEVWIKLAEVQRDYEEAVNTVRSIVHENGKKTHQKEGVSVSN